MGDKHIQPPQLAKKTLQLLVRNEYLEEIEGDLFEEYLDKYTARGKTKSNIWYWVSVFSLIRRSLVRFPLKRSLLIFPEIVLHNIGFSFRRFNRQRTTFTINLVGLSTGIAAAFLIFLWIEDEQQIDSFHPNDDQLYWAMTHFELPSGKVTWDYTSGRLAESLKKNFPEIKESVRIGNKYFTPKGVVSFDESNVEIKGLYVSPNFFEVFHYPLKTGSPKNLLESKESIAISTSLAESLFGTHADPIGKIVQWESRMFNRPFIVTGVFENTPNRSTKQFDAVIHYEVLIEEDPWADHWNGGYAETFFVLNEGTDIDALNGKIENYFDDKVANGNRFDLFLIKYSDNYLHGDYEDGSYAGGRIENVRLFGIVALLILLIACINFMNLTTAQASSTIKSVGIQKAIGANRSIIISQIYSESLIISFVSLAVALGLVLLSLPTFNLIVNKELAINFSDHIVFAVSLMAIVGFLAGSYPAFFLSAFKPIQTLRGKIQRIGSEEGIRKGLVIFQFTLSIVLIISVIIVNKQLDYTLSKPLGYDRTQIVTFELKGTNFEIVQPMLNDLRQVPGIASVSNMAGDFLWGNDSQSGFSWDAGEEDDKHLFKSPKIGYNVIETLGIELLAGRSFSPGFNDDESKIIINEAAVDFIGLEDPIGYQLQNGDEYKEIIGVVKNFQYGSLHQKIEPLIFRFRDWGGEFIVKMQEGSETVTFAAIEEIYKNYLPKNSFEPRFLEEDYAALYSKEKSVGEVSNLMAGLAIIISCLGLLGLSSFSADRRKKEIGIRKVLGAGYLSIIALLTSSFTRLVLVSILIATPIGYFLIQKWLSNFAYTIDLEWTYFILAALIAISISWITIAAQTLNSALANPVDSLRNE